MIHPKEKSGPVVWVGRVSVLPFVWRPALGRLQKGFLRFFTH
jgi:hypothetical protein